MLKKCQSCNIFKIVKILNFNNLVSSSHRKYLHPLHNYLHSDCRNKRNQYSIYQLKCQTSPCLTLSKWEISAHTIKLIAIIKEKTFRWNERLHSDVCVCARVRACVRACVRARARVCVCVWRVPLLKLGRSIHALHLENIP